MVDMQTIMDEMRKTQEILKPKDKNQKSNDNKNIVNNNENTDLQLPELNIPQPISDENQFSNKEILKDSVKTKVQKEIQPKTLLKVIQKKSNNNSLLLTAVQELNGNITELLQLLKSTADEMKKEDPLVVKLEQVADQNDKIAQALLSVADMIKEFQTQQSSLSNVSAALTQEVSNNPNIPVYREPNYSFSQNKMQMPSFRPKFIASNSGAEMELPKPPSDDYASFEEQQHRLQPMQEMKSSKISNESEQREELKPLNFNKPPISLSDMKKKGLFL